MWRWKSKQRIVLLLDEQLVSLSLNHILHSRWQTVDELFVHRCQPVCQNCTDAMQYGRWWNLSRCQVQVQVQDQVQADRAIRHFCWQAPIWSQLSAASCRAAAVSLYLGQVCSSTKQLVRSRKCFSLSLQATLFLDSPMPVAGIAVSCRKLTAVETEKPRCLVQNNEPTWKYPTSVLCQSCLIICT